jgi:GGDEF domain-containing protein
MRAVAWTTVIALLVLRVGLWLLPLDWRTELALADGLTYLLPMLVVLFLLMRAKRHTSGMVESALWGMLALATGLVLLAESYWTWYALTIEPHGPPPGTPLHLLHLGALCSLWYVVIRMSSLRGQPFVHRLRFHLELVGLGCIVFPVSYVGWTYPAVSRIPGAGNAAAVTFAIYPIAGVLLLLGVTSVFVPRKKRSWRSWERLTAASLGIYAAGMIACPFWYPAFLLSEDFGPAWFTAVLGAGYWLLGVAVVYRLSAPEHESIREPWPRGGRVGRWTSGGIPVLMALGLPALGWAALTNENGEISRTLVAVAIVLALVLVSRAVIADYIRARSLQQDVLDTLRWPLSRTEFDMELDSSLARSSERGAPLSVVVFTVHDSPGLDSAIGRSASEDRETRLFSTIRSSFGGNCPILRLCSDQFVMVCEEVDVHEAASLARRAWLDSRHDAEDEPAKFSLCSGVAGYPLHGAAGATLLAHAQSACLEAVENGGEPVVVFDECVHATVEDHEDRMRSRVMRETVRSLARAVDARNPHTRDHSTNVSELAVALGRVLDLPESDVHRIGLAALMHDVGKVGLRDQLLINDSQLTDDEQLEIQGHVLLGEMILAPANIDVVIPAVRHHHERWDGLGYPDGLAGHDIPLDARILAVCDAFDTMSSGGPFREGVSPEQAIAQLEQEAGVAYDPMVIAAFARLVRGLRAPSTNTLRPAICEPDAGAPEST